MSACFTTEKGAQDEREGSIRTKMSGVIRRDAGREGQPIDVTGETLTPMEFPRRTREGGRIG